MSVICSYCGGEGRVDGGCIDYSSDRLTKTCPNCHGNGFIRIEGTGVTGFKTINKYLLKQDDENAGIIETNAGYYDISKLIEEGVVDKENIIHKLREKGFYAF